MKTRFTCRGFSGYLRKITYAYAPDLFVAWVFVGPQAIEHQARTSEAARSGVRRKVDTVARELGRRR